MKLFVDVISHRGSGGDRIDSGDLAEHVGNKGYSLVAITSHISFFSHNVSYKFLID